MHREYVITIYSIIFKSKSIGIQKAKDRYTERGKEWERHTQRESDRQTDRELKEIMKSKINNNIIKLIYIFLLKLPMSYWHTKERQIKINRKK